MAKSQPLREQAIDKIQRIPRRKLELVVDFLSYLEDREGWEATMEFMNDAGMRRDVEEGRAQVQRRQGKSWRRIQADV